MGCNDKFIFQAFMAMLVDPPFTNLLSFLKDARLTYNDNMNGLQSEISDMTVATELHQ